MSTMLPSIHGKSWHFQVTVLCLILGALLGLALKTQKHVIATGLPNRPGAIRAAYIEMQQENKKLQSDITYYKTRAEEASQQLASGARGTKQLLVTMEETKVLAGTTAVQGPGIVVTIEDSPKIDKMETDPEVLKEFIVHDYDLLAVTNELLAAGAEAVSINGYRWVATSSIRCVGPVIAVNTIKIAPPYTVNAVGDPEDLEYALMKTRGGAAESLIYMEMISVKKQSRVVVPPYTGSTRFSAAKSIEHK